MILFKRDDRAYLHAGGAGIAFMDKHARFMRAALDQAYEGCKNGAGGPFGACIARRGKVIAAGNNQVLRAKDPTRHAEICAIGRASKLLGTHDLSGCEIYSTTEPCVMCFAAIHWAKIDRVFFGTTVGDVKRLGFNELAISNKTLKRLGRSPIRIFPGVGRQECRELLQYWKKLPGRKTY